MIAIASGLRPPSRLGPDPLLALARAVGAAGIEAGAGTTVETLRALAPRSMVAGTPITAVRVPRPESPPGPGRRVAWLSATDPEERRAAVALVERTIDASGPAEGRHLIIDLGQVELAGDEATTRVAFARGGFDPDAPPLAPAVRERLGRSPAVLDGCRFALERVLAIAERRGCFADLAIGWSPWRAPTPREALTLLDEFAGAPVGIAYEMDRLAILETLGLAPGPRTRRALALAARVVALADAVGLEGGFLPGLGEPSRDDSIAGMAADVPRIITGRPHSTEEEVALAVANVAGSQPPAGSRPTAESGPPG